MHNINRNAVYLICMYGQSIELKTKFTVICMCLALLINFNNLSKHKWTFVVWLGCNKDLYLKRELGVQTRDTKWGFQPNVPIPKQ